jgi:host factor-I protein
MGVRMMMQKTHFNIQDQFLNQCRKAHIKVEVILLSGNAYTGYIRSFDSFCIIVEHGETTSLVYKHALSMLRPADPAVKVPGIA